MERTHRTMGILSSIGFRGWKFCAVPAPSGPLVMVTHGTWHTSKPVILTGKMDAQAETLWWLFQLIATIACVPLSSIGAEIRIDYARLEKEGVPADHKVFETLEAGRCINCVSIIPETVPVIEYSPLGPTCRVCFERLVKRYRRSNDAAGRKLGDELMDRYGLGDA